MGRRQSTAMVWRHRAIGGAGVMLLLTAAAALGAQNTQRPRQVPQQSISGSVSFALYCASCHGRGGRGDGPVAAALRSAPPDLTTLARRNGGQFPRAQVISYIDGSRRVPSHGPSDMPVWGEAFRALEASGSPLTVKITNLVAFIESIQVGPEPQATAGAGPDRPGTGRR